MRLEGSNLVHGDGLSLVNALFWSRLRPCEKLAIEKNSELGVLQVGGAHQNAENGKGQAENHRMGPPFHCLGRFSKTSFATGSAENALGQPM